MMNTTIYLLWFADFIGDNHANVLTAALCHHFVEKTLSFFNLVQGGGQYHLTGFTFKKEGPFFYFSQTYTSH